MRHIREYLLLGLTIGLLAAGCAPTRNVGGYSMDDVLIAGIENGVDDKGSVLDTLGSPSNVSPFGTDTWYYVNRKTERLAFFKEKVLDQRVLAITFDESGVVSEVRHYGAEDARAIAMNERVTPTSGRQLSVLQQLFGNLGRFARDEGNQ